MTELDTAAQRQKVGYCEFAGAEDPVEAAKADFEGKCVEPVRQAYRGTKIGDNYQASLGNE